MSTNTGNAATIDGELRYLLGTKWTQQDVFSWPPDLFAVCAWLLELTGAYVRVVEHWPPGRTTLERWRARVSREAASLIVRSARNASLVRPIVARPQSRYVDRRWKTIVKHRHTLLSDARRTPALSDALIELVAIADEASVGLGVPAMPESTHHIDDPELFATAEVLLTTAGTLTPRFPTSRLAVLPKQHTPQSGLTLRSLTHHLALFTGGEVHAAWSTNDLPRGDSLNLLVVPWPYETKPTQFSKGTTTQANLADDFACFDYVVPRASSLLADTDDDGVFRDWLVALCKKAESSFGEIHGIVFPESALCEKDFLILNEVALARGAFAVAGVSSPCTDPVSASDEMCIDTTAKNEVWMAFGTDPERLFATQSKHHRWQLNRAQLEMYGLGGVLNPNRTWWENIELETRDVNFVSLHAQMTICCLVCEDLARQDPVSNLVRAVGPNLVIALLSDGPQLSVRWPARYATVLADDPGCSVLTVTSFGMTELAQPPKGLPRRPAVILWKEASGLLREIDLEDDAAAVVLNLWSRCATEYTADSRGDEGVAAYPSLAGVHQVRVPRKVEKMVDCPNPVEDGSINVEH